MAHVYIKNVPLIGQPDRSACWMTAAEMVFGYFRQLRVRTEPLSKLSRKVSAATRTARPLDETAPRGPASGAKNSRTSVVTTGSSPSTRRRTACGPSKWCWGSSRRFGPLVLAGKRPHYLDPQTGQVRLYGHAMVVTGADMVQDRVYLNDPWPVNQGTRRWWGEDNLRNWMVPSARGGGVRVQKGPIGGDRFGQVTTAL